MVKREFDRFRPLIINPFSKGIKLKVLNYKGVKKQFGRKSFVEEVFILEAFV